MKSIDCLLLGGNTSIPLIKTDGWVCPCVLLYIPRCPGRCRGECGRGSVGDVVVRIRLFLLLVRQLQKNRERYVWTGHFYDPPLQIMQQNDQELFLCIVSVHLLLRRNIWWLRVEKQQTCKRPDHNSSTTVIRRIQFPQSSILCLPPVSRDKEGGRVHGGERTLGTGRGEKRQ